jgi:hypothetical protein
VIALVVVNQTTVQSRPRPIGRKRNKISRQTFNLFYVRVEGPWMVVRVEVMVFNATFNNFSDISWRSVLLVEENSVPREVHRPAASHCQTLSHDVLSSTPRHEQGSNSQL